MSYIPFINNSSTINYVNKNGQGKVFVPNANAPSQKWVCSTYKNVQHGKNNVVKGSTSTVVHKNGANSDSKGSKKYAFNNNYKGKNPMTRNQWRRFQRSKKRVVASCEDETVNPKGK